MMSSRWYSVERLIKQYKTNLKESDPERLKWFLRLNGFDRVAVPGDGGALRWVLENGKMPSGRKYIPSDHIPYQDHARLFKNSDTGQACLVFHPYRDPVLIRPELEVWVKKYGLKVEVYPKEYSWYYPGHSALVVISMPHVAIKIPEVSGRGIEPCCFQSDKGDCKALKVKEAGCELGKCPFYKTSAEQERSLSVARERCRKLRIPFGKDYRGPVW